MGTWISAVADRLLSVVVPAEVAGACACGDTYCAHVDCQDYPGTHYYTALITTNCQCQVVHTTCGC